MSDKALRSAGCYEVLKWLLGLDKHEAVANDSGNPPFGSSAKTLKGDFGTLPIDISRDRDGSFKPQLVIKHQTRRTGFDDKILSLYSRGMTVREMQSRLKNMYGIAVSPILISPVTDAVMDEVKAWQAGAVWVKAVYLALGVNLQGDKQLLGL